MRGIQEESKRWGLIFYEISYGSLGESRYLFNFALKENWLSIEEYQEVIKLADEIGAMLYSEIKNNDKE